MLGSATPVPVMTGPPHFVDLHVNPGESVSIQMVDGNETILRGPATITMVSQHTYPPVPMPVQVPPGHMVQQIVDENGTLRHIILSALNNSGSGSPSSGPASSGPLPILQVSQTDISQVSPHGLPLVGPSAPPPPPSANSSNNSKNNNSNNQHLRQQQKQPPSPNQQQQQPLSQQQPQVPVPSSSSSSSSQTSNLSSNPAAPVVSGQQPPFSSFPCCCSCCYSSCTPSPSGVPLAIPGSNGGLPASSGPHPALLGCFPAPMTLANGSLCPTPVLPTGVVPTTSLGSATNGGNGSSSARRRTPSRNSYSYSKRSNGSSSNNTCSNLQNSNGTHINLNPLLSSTPNCPPVSMSGLIPTAAPFILPNNLMNNMNPANQQQPPSQNNLPAQQLCSNNLSGNTVSSSKTSNNKTSGNTHQLSPTSNEFHYIHGINKNLIIPSVGLTNGRPSMTSGSRVNSSSRQVPQAGIPNSTTLVPGFDQETNKTFLLNGANFSSQIHHNQQQSELISGHKVSHSEHNLNNKVSTSSNSSSSTTPSIMTSHAVVSVSKNHSMSSSSQRSNVVSSSVTSSHSFKAVKTNQVTSSNLNSSSSTINYCNKSPNNSRQEVVHGDQSTPSSTVNLNKNNNLSMNASSASSASVSPNSLDSSSYSEVSSLDSSFSRSSSSSMNVTPLSSRQLYRLPNGSVSLTSGYHPHQQQIHSQQAVNGPTSNTMANNTRKSSSSSVSSSASSSPPTNGSLLANNNFVNINNTNASAIIPTSPSLNNRSKNARSRKDDKNTYSLDTYNSNTDSAVDSCPENVRDRINQQDITTQISGKQNSNSTSSSTLTMKSSSPTTKPGSSVSNSLDDLDDDDDVESQDDRKVCVTSMTITNQSHIEPYEAYVNPRSLVHSNVSSKSQSSPNSPISVLNSSNHFQSGTNNAYQFNNNTHNQNDPNSSSFHLQSLSLSSSPIISANKKSSNNRSDTADFSSNQQPMSSSSSASSVLVIESSAAVTTASLRKKTKDGISVNHSMSSKPPSSTRHLQDLDSNVVSQSTTSQKVTKKQKDKIVNNENSSTDEKSSSTPRKNKKSSLVMEGKTSGTSSSTTSSPSKKSSQDCRPVVFSKKSDFSSQGPLELGSSCSISSQTVLRQDESSQVSPRKVANNERTNDGSASRRKKEVTSHKQPSKGSDYMVHDDLLPETSEEVDSSKNDLVEERISVDKRHEEEDVSQSSSSLEVKQQKLIPKGISPKHLLMSAPQFQLLNLTYTALTATSVKLKWNLVSGAEPHPEDQHKVLLLIQQKTSSVGGLFSLQFRVEMIQPKNPCSSVSLSPRATLQDTDKTVQQPSLQDAPKDESSCQTTETPTNSENTLTNQSASSSPAANIRNVYQGTYNTCRVNHLNGGQQYSFRVRTFLDSEYCVISNLLTITTPEQALTSRSSNKHKGKGSSCNANGSSCNANGSPSTLLIQDNSQRNESKKNKDVVSKNPVVEEDTRREVENEKKDQRRAVMILLIFTLSTLFIAILIQQLLGSAFESAVTTVPVTESISPSTPVSSLPLPPVPSLPYPPV